jgi:exodeoxyribonuclease-3
MNTLKLYSWNVNGLRAAERKGFFSWLEQSGADSVSIQETKLQADQLHDGLTVAAPSYTASFSHAERKGYSGVATYVKIKHAWPSREGFGVKEFDSEGRVLVTEITPTVLLINVYFPNGGSGPERLDYKMRFYAAFLKFLQKERKAGKSIILCGDVNTAHTEIDLARPKQNEKVSGFLPEERAWVSDLLAAGFIDTFRHFHPEQLEAYTWWDQKTRARDRNVGWRIDYFFVSDDLAKHLVAADVHQDILGSDHCPVSITIKL